MEKKGVKIFILNIMLMVSQGGFSMELIGHRGSSDEAPENSRESIDLAFKQGAKGAECDVHLTRDQKIVLIHDSNLKRTTGTDLEVSLARYDEIAHLDAGSWKGEEWRGKNVRIPLLSDVIPVVPSQGIFFIELKEGNKGLPHLISELVPEAIKKEQGRLSEKNIAFISFDLGYIDEIKKLLPQYKAYYITNYSDPQNQVTNQKQLKLLMARAKENHIDGIDFEFGPMINKEFIGEVKSAGLESIVWVMKEDDQIENVMKCQKAGVDFFTTNTPLLMKTALKK